MNIKLETNKVPDGYISIGAAAEMLDMEPFDLRILMHNRALSKKTHGAPMFRTCSAPNRLLYVLEADIRKFKERRKEGDGTGNFYRQEFSR